MKKFGSFALVALLVAALGASASAANSYSAAKGTATVDGKKDDIYVCDAVTIDVAESTGKTATDGATGKAWLAYDENNLYVYVEVTDSTVTDKSKVTSIYQNDSIEVYVNFSGKEDAIANINAAQLTYGPSFTTIAGGGKYQSENKDDVKTAFTYTDDGYTIEMAIPFVDFDAEEGATFTFGVGINDDADGDASTREYHNFDAANMGSAWSKADSNWATVTLSDKKYTPKTESAADTADMGIIAAAASLAASGAAFISLKKRK